MGKLIKVLPHGNFYVQEFASPWWFDNAKNADHVLQGLRLNAQPMIEGTQAIRDIFSSPITINNWHRGGEYSESGLRTPLPVAMQKFALFSGHMFWNCGDLKFEGYATDDVFHYILDNQDQFPMIIALEDINFTRSKHGKLGRDWLHIHFGWRRAGQKITVFKP